MRQTLEDERIRISPLTAALEFVFITRSSTIHSFVAETIARSFSSNSWTQMCFREMAEYISSHSLPHSSWNLSVLHTESTDAETIASSFSGSSWTLNSQKVLVVPSDFQLIAHPKFRLRGIKLLRQEQRTPGETSGRHDFLPTGRGGRGRCSLSSCIGP